MRAPFAALAASALIFAGCMGSSAPTDPGAPVNPNTSGSTSGLPTGTGNAAAAGGPLTDAISPATAWVRGLWGEATQFTLIDETGTMNNQGDTDVMGCLVDCGGAFFQPAEGLFVPPGASVVEVTATWTDAPTALGMVVDFVYRTAADSDSVFDRIRSGEAFIIQVAEKDTDVPLAPGSQWWFNFFPEASPFGFIPPTDIAVKVIVKRAPGDLPVFGDAPDPWAGKTSVTLLQGAVGDEQILFTPQTFSCLQCRTGWDSSGPGLVGPGARSIEATATWNWPGLAKPILHYWNSQAGGADPVPLDTDGDTSRTFVLDGIPLDQMDSPHQHRSTWGFWVSLDGGPLPAGTAIGQLSLNVNVLR